MSRPLGLVLALLVLSPAARASDAPVLRVGMETRTPPWSYVPGLDYSTEDLTKDPAITEAQIKKLVGLDVDVMNALAKRLPATLKIVPVSWFGSEAGLLQKHFDLVICGWTPSKNTPSSIVWSVPYYEWGLLVAVRSDNKRILGYGDLAGAKVGHYKDAAAERTVRSLGAGTLVPYDGQEALFDDLKAGKLAAVLFDSLYVRWRIANDPSFRAVGEPLNKLGYHVGVRREDAALYAQVQAAVRSLVSSGEMTEIRKRWEGR